VALLGQRGEGARLPSLARSKVGGAAGVGDDVRSSLMEDPGGRGGW